MNQQLIFAASLFFSFLPLFSQTPLFLTPAFYNRPQFESIQQQIQPPEGYNRVEVEDNSFAVYLRNMPIVDSVNVLNFKNHVSKPWGMNL